MTSPTGPLSDLSQAKLAPAILVTCVVQTLNEFDGTFQPRFLDRLAKAYRELRDNPAMGSLDDLEILDWTREYLTGFSKFTGQGEPFLGGD